MSLKYLVFVGLFTLALNFEGHKFLRERYVMFRNAWNCSEVAEMCGDWSGFLENKLVIISR